MEELTMTTAHVEALQKAVLAKMKEGLAAAGIDGLDAPRVIAYVEAHPTLKDELRAAFPSDPIMAEDSAAVVGEMIRAKKRLTIQSVSEAMVEAYMTGTAEVKEWIEEIMRQTNNSYEAVAEKFRVFYQERGLRFDNRGFFIGFINVLATTIRVVGDTIRFVFNGIAWVVTAVGDMTRWCFHKLGDGIDHLSGGRNVAGTVIV
jgi:hypothetical protein